MSEVRVKKRGGAIRALLTLAWCRFRHTTGWSGRVDSRFREPTHGKNGKMSVLFLIMGAMLLAGIYGGLLWHGTIWPLVSALVIFWFLGIAIWQRRV